MVPTLLGVLAVVFFVMAYSPGGLGGRRLDMDGAQKQGENAKRVQRQLARRFGIDQPKPVQFGRWLNQVSPVGFRMSSDVVLSYEEAPEVVEAVRETLADEPFNTRERTAGSRRCRW